MSIAIAPLTRNHIFKKATNETLTIFAKQYSIGQQLPSETSLAQKTNVSRATIRTILSHLIDLGIVSKDGRKKKLQCLPIKKDYFIFPKDIRPQGERAEKFILNKLLNGQLAPGETFSERQLSKSAGCTTITMREALIKISHSGLISKQPRHSWQVTSLHRRNIIDLYEARELLEHFAIDRLIDLPNDHIIWKKLKHSLDVHQKTKNASTIGLTILHKLDSDFHETIYSVLDNHYLNALHQSMKTIVQFQQQHNTHHISQTRAMTLTDHINILEALLRRDKKASHLAAKKHLKTSLNFMLSHISKKQF